MNELILKITSFVIIVLILYLGICLYFGYISKKEEKTEWLRNKPYRDKFEAEHPGIKIGQAQYH